MVVQLGKLMDDLIILIPWDKFFVKIFRFLFFLCFFSLILVSLLFVLWFGLDKFLGQPDSLAFYQNFFSFLFILFILLSFCFGLGYVLALVRTIVYKKVYIFNHQRISVWTRTYQFLPAFRHFLLRAPLDDDYHTGNTDEKTYQLKYLTHWNVQSSFSYALNGSLIQVTWHYHHREEKEEMVMGNILYEHWEQHKARIFQWIEEERKNIDRFKD